MPSDPESRPRQKPPERSQTPLWFAVGGLAASLYSRAMHDEGIADVVLVLGIACAVIAVAYWAVRPRHGF